MISLGTGTNKTENKYNAKMAAQWGPMSWIYYNGSAPILDVYMEASVDMVDFHSAVVLQAFGSQEHHLRIEVSPFGFLFLFFYIYAHTYTHR